MRRSLHIYAEASSPVIAEATAEASAPTAEASPPTSNAIQMKWLRLAPFIQCTIVFAPSARTIRVNCALNSFLNLSVRVPFSITFKRLHSACSYVWPRGRSRWYSYSSFRSFHLSPRQSIKASNLSKGKCRPPTLMIPDTPLLPCQVATLVKGR